MCKILEDMRNEAATKAAREASIFMAIETFRECDVAENVIKEKIMGKFNLSTEEAKEYMLGKSA